MRRSDGNQAYRELLGVIRGIRRRWRVRVLLQGLAATAAVALATLLLGGWVAQRWGLEGDGAMPVRAAVGLVVALAAAWFLVRPLLRRVRDVDVALYLEEHEPSLEAAVLSALEAGGEGRDPLSDNPLLARTLEAAVRRCHALDDGRYLEQRPLIRVVALLVGLVAVGGILGFLGGTRPVGALLGSGQPVAGERPAILVQPGDATVPRGADVQLSARLQALDAELVELVVRSAGDTAVDRLAMAAGEDGRWGYLLFDLDVDAQYWVEAGGVRAGPYTLTVAELPYVDRLDLELDYPAYSGLADRVVEDGGDVAALQGTRVRVRVTPTVPVAGGGLVVDGADPIPLAPDSGGTLSAVFTVRADGFYRILLDGPRGVALDASPRYVVDALSDGDPVVSFPEPGRDERATPIDELFVEARAEDDYGIARLTLHYAVNGGDESTVALYGGRGGLDEVVAGHTFYLEEYGLEPGDLVAYWATAADNDAVAGSKEATSDIYFIRIRPFQREFSAAEERGPARGGPPADGADGDLSERQRQIIAGTFNLVRDADDTGPGERRENLNTLALSQEELRDRTRELARRMVSRAVALDSAFAVIAGILPRAAEEMERAAARLRAGEPREALGPEQRALQQLQRAEAVFREVQVSLGQQQGGGGAGESAMSDDLADLFELERDRLQDQYETVQRGPGAAGDSASAALDETARRLEELARRQQREAERQRNEALRGRGTAGGGAQRELAGEVEEEARRLERLSRERNEPGLQDAARRLRDAAESMRRSAAGAGEAERAGERLREARRLLDRSRSEAVRQRAAELRDRSDALARGQEEVARETERLLEQRPGAERDRRLGALDARKRAQARDVAGLEEELRRLSRDAAGEEPEAARRLREAAGELADRQTERKIDFSRQLQRRNAPAEYLRDLEASIQEDLDAVRDELEEAEAAFGDGAEEAERERAVEEAADLARGLESMRQRGGELREGMSGNPTGGAGFAPGAARQQRGEARERLEDAESLRRRLAEQGVDTEDADAVVDGLRRLTGEGPYRDAGQAARLQEEVADRAKRLELTVRFQLAGEDRLRLFLSGSPDIDPEYRALVEAYYRSLSQDDDGGGE